MKTVALFIIFGIVCLTKVVGQKKLTRDEILIFWTKSEKPLSDDSVINTQFDNALDIQINKVLDSLKNKKIDSLIVYSSAYPGSGGYNKCRSGLIQTYTYIIWKTGDVTNIQKIVGNCTFKVVRLNSTEMFQFYETNYIRLNSEFFMPVILSGREEKEERVSFIMRYIDHEPKYCIYYIIGNIHRTLKFSESQIEDEEGLFIDHNQKLAGLQWWQVIKRFTSDIKEW